MSLTLLYRKSTGLYPYPELAHAFGAALEREMDRLRLIDDLRQQVMDSEKGAGVRFNRQGSRHELALRRWIGERGRLHMFSVVVRQNNADEQPYGFGEKAQKPKWDTGRWMSLADPSLTSF